MSGEDDYDLEDDEEGLIGWVSPWGLAVCGVAALATVQATVLGLRFLTVGLAAVGLVLLVVGLGATREERRPRDKVWLTLGGILNGAVLILTLILPGLLSEQWAIDTPVSAPDMNARVLVPHNRPLEEGKPMGEDDWADAATEAIRQEDLLVRVESVKVGALPGQGGECLLIHLRLGNCRKDIIPLEGFSPSGHAPKLSDDAGGSYTLREVRRRRPARGEPVFEAGADRATELLADAYQDYLLAYTPPPSRFGTLKLEVPAAAWGRQGVCRLRISGLFDAPPAPKTN